MAMGLPHNVQAEELLNLRFGFLLDATIHQWLAQIGLLLVYQRYKESYRLNTPVDGSKSL